MKRISIVAGSTISERFFGEIRKSDLILGVDRGAHALLRRRIVPDIALGDFDSVTALERTRIEKKAKKVLVFPRKKDKTDLELAVDMAISFRPKEVKIFGALGRRFDHAMAAVHLLLKLSSHNIYGEIVDNFNKMFVVRRQKVLTKDKHFRYVSLIPLTHEVLVSLRGFAYDIARGPLPQGATLGVSNEIRSAQATVSVISGYVLVIQSRD